MTRSKRRSRRSKRPTPAALVALTIITVLTLHTLAGGNSGLWLGLAALVVFAAIIGKHVARHIRLRVRRRVDHTIDGVLDRVSPFRFLRPQVTRTKASRSRKPRPAPTNRTERIGPRRQRQAKPQPITRPSNNDGREPIDLDALNEALDSLD